MLAMTNDLAKRIVVVPPSVEGLMALRDVVETVDWEASEEDLKSWGAVLLKTFKETLDILAQKCRAEGARLDSLIIGQMDTIPTLTREAFELAARRPTTVQTRLVQQVAAILDHNSGLLKERLFQESVLLTTRWGAREELNRLNDHVAANRESLGKDGVVDWWLHFLAQEFNRTTNTLCSKFWDASLTKIGIELKTVIDQFREQAQNFE